MAPDTVRITALASRVAGTKLGVRQYLSLASCLQNELWDAAKAYIEKRQRPCGRCGAEALIDPEKVVAFKARLVFMCDGCHETVEQVVERPPLDWPGEGV